jgi:NADH dehydrogenase [ubiquinone] 1 alpha subcomplex assembly factor 7
MLSWSPPCVLPPSFCSALLTFHSAIHCAQQHPELGYYTRSGAEVIGSSGDFITAPEISQLFGELLCIWCVATWQDLGCPSSFHIVEAGPGKGTLIAGLLRSSKAFPDFRAALSAVHLVETSSSMREKQAAALGCSLGATDVAGGQVAIPLRTSNSSSGTTITTAAGAAAAAAAGDTTAAGAAGKRSLAEGLAVHWHRALSEVPPGCTLLLAQELLDALPVHQFEYTAGGWRERLVDIDETSSSSNSSSSSDQQSSSSSSSSSDAASAEYSDSTASSNSSSSDSSSSSSGSSEQQHSSAGSGLHFRHVLSPKGTPATRLLLEMQGASGIEPKPGGGSWEIGDRLEVCPLAMAFVQEVSAELII